MSFWWIDRTLPGIIGSVVVAAAVGLSHYLLKRHVTKVTADQTAELAGRVNPGARAEKRLLDDYRRPRPHSPQDP